MIPLRDDNPTTLKPVVTIGIVAVCTLVFLWQATLPPADGERLVYGLGLVPAVLFGRAELPPELAMVPAELSLFTSMFLHAGWLHLIGNMLYLWIFGNNVEDALGHVRFVGFYLVCGLAAALAQALQAPDSTIPMVGASGAIGGVLGAYLVLFPSARVLVLLPLGLFTRIIRVPAIVALGFWFVLQFLGGFVAGAEGGGIAYWAHIGGFVAGAVLVLPLRRRGIGLLKGITRPRGPWG